MDIYKLHQTSSSLPVHYFLLLASEAQSGAMVKWEGIWRWETPNTEPLVAASELERLSFLPPGGGTGASFGSSRGRYLFGLESLHAG